LREISLHILDISENGITAGADCIEIVVEEDIKGNLLKIEITDNGSGIPSEMFDKVTDPFVTSRTTRKVGLGLSLLETSSQRCGGDFSISSGPGKGTRVSATFIYDHIDRAPIGDMAGSISALIIGNPYVDFIYKHSVDGKHFILNTRKIKEEKGADCLTDAVEVYQITCFIRESLERLKTDEGKNGKIDN
jgi:hypothetical protein